MPSCLYCLDRGGHMGPRGWIKCQCRKAGTKEQVAWNRYANSIGAKNPAPRPGRQDEHSMGSPDNSKQPSESDTSLRLFDTP